MTDTNSPEGAATSFLMERRQFIASTAIGMAGLWAFSPSALMAAPPTDPLPLLSIGFWKAHASLTKSGGLISSWSSLNVQPANEVTSSDPTFLRAGAEVQVLGYVRPAPRRGVPLSIGFDALYTNPQGGDKLPFLAWSYASVSTGETSGGPSRFLLPVGASDALDLRVTRRPPVQSSTTASSRRRVVTAAVSSDETRAEVTSFSINGLPGTQKLQRGVYFIAVRETAAEPLPDWSGVEVADQQKDELVVDLRQDGLLRRSSALGSEPVPFSYLVVAIRPAAEVMGRAARH
jgi:hypothetical protein